MGFVARAMKDSKTEERIRMTLSGGFHFQGEDFKSYYNMTINESNGKARLSASIIYMSEFIPLLL